VNSVLYTYQPAEMRTDRVPVKHFFARAVPPRTLGTSWKNGYSKIIVAADRVRARRLRPLTLAMTSAPRHIGMTRRLPINARSECIFRRGPNSVTNAASR
jgi:hypothetical protein